MKRAIDIVLSGGGLLVLGPVMLLVGVLVRLGSPGGAIFRQVRVGLHGRQFELLKFRSMRNDAAGPAVTSDNDPRITRLGQVIRSTKLDELPQLINVLKGDMSLVGPRPEVPKYVEHWPGDLRSVILSVRPGITDPASIRFRRESEILAASDDPEKTYVEVLLPEKVALYVEYVQTRSTWGDLRLLLRTARTTVRD